MEERMTGYIKYLWNHTKVMRKGIKQSEVLADMPEAMCHSVLMFLYGNDVKKVPLFTGLEDGFIKQLVTHLEDCVCLADDFVFIKGDIGTNMFFIRDGKARVLADAPVTNAKYEGGLSLSLSLLSLSFLSLPLTFSSPQSLFPHPQSLPLSLSPPI
jgi:hypothetical protein